MNYDICSINLNEMASDHIRANITMERELLFYFFKLLLSMFMYMIALGEKHICKRPRFLQDTTVIPSKKWVKSKITWLIR